jgi:hypothetical protein
MLQTYTGKLPPEGTLAQMPISVAERGKLSGGTV